MMSLPVWLPGLVFFLGGSLFLVPCSFQGGSQSRGGLPGQRPPRYGREQVVRILLEAFLFFHYFRCLRKNVAKNQSLMEILAHLCHTLEKIQGS